MYRDGVDALIRLLSGLDDEGRPLELPEIASCLSSMHTLTNGIRYCSVQVLLESGVEYRIDAFGDEAEALHLRAKTYPMSRLLTTGT